MFNPYAAGHKVYRGGSSAATVGPVDKMGYKERSLKNAARAKIKSKAQSKTNGQGGVDTLQPPVPMQTPLVQSSNVGTLQLDPSAIQGQAEIDSEYNANNRSLDSSYNRTQQEYYTQSRDAGIAQQQDQRQDLNNFSGRGLAHSSGYATEVQNSGTQFANLFADLLSNKQLNEQEINDSRLANNDYRSNGMSRVALDLTDRLNSKAGTLNLNPNYVDPAKAPMPKPTPTAGYRTGAPKPKPTKPTKPKASKASPVKSAAAKATAARKAAANKKKAKK